MLALVTAGWCRLAGLGVDVGDWPTSRTVLIELLMLAALWAWCEWCVPRLASCVKSILFSALTLLVLWAAQYPATAWARPRSTACC